MPIRPTIGALLLLTLSANGVSAAPIGPAPDVERRLSEYAYDYWGIEDDLPQNTVMAMVQDHTGYLWLGTFSGLARYDGVEFRRFVHPEMPVLERGATDLLLDDDGTLWVGTQAGGLIRVGTDGSVRHFGSEHGLPSNIIWTTYRDPQGRLWVGTASGVCELVEERFRCLGPESGLPTAPVSGIRMTPDLSLWVGTEGSGLFRLAGGQAESFEAIDGVSILRVQDLELDRDGTLWIATFGAGLVEYRDGQFRRWGREDGLASTMIRALLVDELDSLWIGTYGAGVQRKIGETFDLLDSGTGLPNGHVQSLLVDDEGSFWFGTNGGLNRLRSAKFSTITTRDGLSGPFVRSVTQDRQGDLWAGIDGHGLSRIREGRVVEVLRAPELLSDSVRALWPANDGGLWIGGYAGGLSHRTPDGAITHYTDELGLAGEHVRAIFEDRTGAVWVATDIDGILRMADGEVRHFRRNHELPSGDYRAIAEAPDGSLWFGSYGRGIQRWDGSEITSLPFLETGIVFAIHFDEDSMGWIGTQQGLFRHHPGDNHIDAVAADEVRDAVFQILDGHDGRLWLCTNNAIYAVTLADGHVDHYDQDHGMLSRQCNGASQPAGWRSEDGRLWFPTADGVSWVDPANLPTNPRPPAVVIQDIRVDGRLASAREDGTIVVPPGARRLELDYAALSFLSPRKQRYRYRMLGLEDEWAEAEDRRSAFYNDLPPGAYTFQVMAANADGVWNRDGADVTVDVQPLVHQTLWFRTLVVATVLLLITGFVRWRGKDMWRQKRRLEREVDTRTRELREALLELEETQDQLVEAEKLAALGSLVAGVAHEINTPVGTSLTIASHLADRSRRDGVDEATRKALDVLQENLERAGQIVARFKRIAVDQEREARRPFRLAMVLSKERLESSERVEELGHHLVIECPHELVVEGHPDALYEVISHLVSNSLSHAFDAPGGTVRITAALVEEQIRIDYADDGSGIPPLIRAHLFEPFSTEKRGSHTGLGMHIVYNIVTRLMRGKIQCLDGPGARFRIDLPLW